MSEPIDIPEAARKRFACIRHTRYRQRLESLFLGGVAAYNCYSGREPRASEIHPEYLWAIVQWSATQLRIAFYYHHDEFWWEDLMIACAEAHPSYTGGNWPES
jgi:hypothetical protein